MDRNWGFEATELGVGGTRVVVPIARDGLGGEDERRVSRWVVGLEGSGKT
jgi:hypothetical protein